MRELERRFSPDVLAIVGVHSGKFLAERETPRIREAMARLDVTHPVVNDRQFRVWRAYAVRAWPTLVVVDPEGYVVAMRAGEFTADRVADAVTALVERHRARGTLASRPLPHAPERPAIAPGTLRHPGKVEVAAAGAGAGASTRMAVADTGHHRLLVGRLEREGTRLVVERVIGARGERGLVDGEAATARFDAPQGVLLDGGTLWVADAGNHVVRAVELATGRVRTVGGTGRQLRARADVDAGALSSPWDLARAGDTLFVALAGIHQLWAMRVRADGTLERPRVHSGQFGEDLLDGAQREALLAQPMGLVAHGGALWFTDAESSAVRRADVAADGAVTTLAGTGLFDFGHRDGTGDEARLQHPQGLAALDDGRLLVADSYNDALRVIDPATRAVTTTLGGLHEPQDVAVLGRTAWIADTGAHRIVRARDGELDEVEIVE